MVITCIFNEGSILVSLSFETGFITHWQTKCQTHTNHTLKEANSRLFVFLLTNAIFSITIFHKIKFIKMNARV